jgi:ATP-dependent protease ClpP protease subunit
MLQWEEMANRSIIFNEAITEENVISLVAEIDTAIAEGDHITLYFSSGGGSLYFGNLLLHRLNSIEEQDLKIVVFGQASSVAFEILIKANAYSKEILSGAYSVLHLYTSQFDYRDDIINMDSTNQIKHLEEYNEKFKDFLYTCNISEEKINAVFDGKNVIIEDEKINECIESYERSKEKKT